MNMNEILESIMTFINENTNILIGICIFLIFVLIGYLIDNSVKSKRVRKDIKNKDQVPENIKNDIIEEAIDNKKVNPIEKENEKFEEYASTPSEPIVFDDKEDDDINDEIILSDNSEQVNDEFENFINDSVKPLDLDNIVDNTEKSDTINNNSSDNGIVDDITIPLDLTEDTTSSKDENSKLSQDEFTIPSDIMSELMNSSNEIDLNNAVEENKTMDISYKNNKRLAEILYNEDENTLDNSSDINENINSNSKDIGLKEESIEVKNNSYDDELDNIMKKLNNINSSENFDEDNYTNIF